MFLLGNKCASIPRVSITKLFLAAYKNFDMFVTEDDQIIP